MGCSTSKDIARVLIGWAFALLASGLHPAARAAEPDLTSLEATRSRPLFSPTRRPPPAPSPVEVGVAAPVEAPPQPPRIQLSGVVIGTGQRIAIVTRLDDSKTLSLEIGSRIDGWTVAMVKPRGITLKHDAHVFTMDLPQPGH